MEGRLLKVGITHGDINGIGYEVILKTFADERITEFCTPIIYGSLKIAQVHQSALQLPTINFKVIESPESAVAGRINIINCVNENTKVELSVSTTESGLAAFKSLEAAVSDIKKGKLDALLTAPINKNNIQSDSFQFSGHTEYLEEIFSEKGKNKSLMILMNDYLRMALVTTHLPLAEVSSKLTKELILEKIILLDQSLRQDFGLVKPRIAVFSLNPHAGDNGLLGTEEQTLILPAIQDAEKNGILVFGPYAADGFFGSQSYLKFDGMLAMYHDQGLAPFKALAMEDGVNYTAGLPIVRTSPAHGTAYDIAGQNKASESSFRHALYALIDIYRNRIMYQKITANPLRKQYIDRGSDNVKLDLTKDESGE